MKILRFSAQKVLDVASATAPLFLLEKPRLFIHLTLAAGKEYERGLFACEIGQEDLVTLHLQKGPTFYFSLLTLLSSVMNPHLAQWPIDHIGIAVTSLTDAVSWYEKTCHATISLREEIVDQGVEVIFLNTPNCKIELLASIRDSSTLAKFLVKRGPGLHHLCYAVTDIRAELARLAGLKIRLIDTEPHHGAANTTIAFLHPESCGGVLTELCEHQSSLE